MQSNSENFTKHDSRAVANFFILRSQNERRLTEFVLTAPTLEKVVLLVHAVHTAFFDKILCSEPVLTGEYEPYFANLKRALEYTENNEIPKLIRVGDNLENYLFAEDSENEVIQAVFNKDQIKLFDLIWKKLIKFDMKCHNLSFFTSNFSNIPPNNCGSENNSVGQRLDKEATVVSIQTAFAA